ncbi:NeuD/PglB/VioB family sugar acetyltransferase protein [Bacillus phage PK1]|nr:NeuD/PglB/VioB family sugar acetyltransferase protein [Bacillus phage PK1]
MKKIVIFGSGGFAREVHQIIDDINFHIELANIQYEFLGFLDGNAENHGKEVHGYPVLGGINWLVENPSVEVVVAIGNPAVKRKVVSEIKSRTSNSFVTLIHPSVIIGQNVTVGEGSVLCANTTITTDISIGEHVILNLDCTVGHDAVIEDYVTAAPSVNVSGNVRVGEGCDLGTNSVVIQGKEIGEWSIVGAGAVVIRDVPANTTSVGNPSKVIKEREEHWQLQY